VAFHGIELSMAAAVCAGMEKPALLTRVTLRFRPTFTRFYAADCGALSFSAEKRRK